MKHFISVLAILFAAITFSACTQQERAKYYGGTVEIELASGQRLVEATWKDSELWYLTEPMPSDYVPTTKTFQESSAWGIMEGKVIFKEHR